MIPPGGIPEGLALEPQGRYLAITSYSVRIRLARRAFARYVHADRGRWRLCPSQCIAALQAIRPRGRAHAASAAGADPESERGTAPIPPRAVDGPFG